MLVIGGRDMEAGVSVRLHGKGNVGAKPKGEVIADILERSKNGGHNNWACISQCLSENEPAKVTIDFAGEEDLDVVKRWRVPRLDVDRPGVRDSLEFARLAAKRWRYYRKSMPAVLNPKELQRVIAADPQAEASLLLLARADWYESSPLWESPNAAEPIATI